MNNETTNIREAIMKEDHTFIKQYLCHNKCVEPTFHEHLYDLRKRDFITEIIYSIEFAGDRDKISTCILLANCQRRTPFHRMRIWMQDYLKYVNHICKAARIILALKRRRITAMRNLDRFLIHELAICVFAERYQKC